MHIESIDGSPLPDWLTIDPISEMIQIYQDDQDQLYVLKDQTFQFHRYSQFDDYVTTQDGQNTVVYQDTKQDTSIFEVTFIANCFNSIKEHDWFD